MAEVRWTPAQSDAIHAKDRSIAVSAAAGSGKTAVLTRRIIEKVCAPDGSGDISRLLVVTFTKAAAAELVSRISDALATKLSEEPENAHIRSQSLLVSSAKISTIHSFCLDLIRTNFQKLDIPPDFSAGDETEIKLMMNEIAEELISDYFENELREGEETIEDFGRFADMFGDVSHTEKLAETMIELYDSLSSTVDFLDRIECFRENAEKAAEQGFDGSAWELCIRRYLLQFLSHYGEIYEDAVQHAASDAKLAKPLAVIASERDTLEKVRSFAEHGAPYGEIQRYLSEFVFDRLTGVSKDDHLRAFSDFRKDFKADLKELTEEYYSYSPEAVSDCLSETANAMAQLGAFLRTFEKRFTAEKARRKLITFADMERLALALLYDKKNDAPTELALSLQGAYDEIYIDEYQDTNEIQDKIFSLIARENNRFNVGDIKQSIYAFRGAKPTIFSALLDSRPKYDAARDDKAVKIFLSENFRSGAEILTFCNGIFEKLMNAEALRYGEDERLHAGGDKHVPLPEMYLIPKAKSDEEEDPFGEADFVASKIEDLLKNECKADGTPIRPSDIAILLRSTATSALAYEEALAKRGIPCKNDASKEFFESAEVLLMLSLLSTIDNPTRDIYLASALKSPLYGVTLDELLFIRRYRTDGSLFDALRAFTLETDFAKGKKFLMDYEKYVLLASETPCDALIWQIYTDTGIFSILSASETQSVYEIEQANANLLSFYHYARSFERGGFKGLSGFISFINEVLANKTKLDVSGFTPPGDVVNIMTIHKSKGLEFPVCFVSGLGKRLNFRESREKTVYHEALGISVKLPAQKGMIRLDTPLRKASLLDMKKQMLEEELRVLYVALTRPKERLFLTASVSVKSAEEGDFDLWREYGKYALKHKYFSAYSLCNSTSYLDLLMTAMAGKQDTFTLQIVSEGQIQEEDAPETVSEALLPSEEKTDMPYYAAKKQVGDRLDYVYPYRRLSEIPSKLSVSGLHPRVLDEADTGKEMDSDVPRILKMPNFLMREADEETTAAEKGTAMHTFMQFCDFDRVLRFGVSAEIDRLAEKRFIFESDKAKMDIEMLSAFFESALAKDMLRSERIFREKRFMIKLPTSLFTEDADEVLAEERLLVQGVIDCAYFNSKGELILADYKTDFFREGTSRRYIEKTLRERHSRQLSYYKLACEQLFGVLPAHTYIYSFALGDTVEIF